MRIYKTRADFTKLQAAQNPSIFAGTICTITDEALNPMYVFQGGVWNSTVTATTNPLTGGSVFLADGWFYGASGIVPGTNNSAGIIAARDKVASIGGGVVQLLPIEYTIDQDIDLVSGVSYVGTPMNVTESGDVPDFWTPGVGTIFTLSPGVTAFKWNNVDKGSKESTYMAFALKQVSIYGICFVGGLRAIDIGARYAMGALWLYLDQIFCYNQTGDYAIDALNCQFGRIGTINLRTSLTSGGGARFGNALDSALYTGDFNIDLINAWCGNPKNRGVVFECFGPAGGILNDVKVNRIRSSRYGPGTPYSVSLVCTSGVANINVPSAAEYDLCQVGMPIKFATTAPTNFDANLVYFVVARTDGTQMVQLAEADYSAAITPGASNTYASYVSGFPTFIARADNSCTVKNCDFGFLACEQTGHVAGLLFSKTRNCAAHLGNPSTSYTNTGLIFRDAEASVTYSGANNVTSDYSGLFGYANMINLAGGPYQHISGDITLNSSWNNRKVRYSGTSDILVNIPRGLPIGFELDLTTTGATGVVTFQLAAGVSGVGLFGKTGFRTNGQYATVRLRKISAAGFALSGDTQV